jgi:hypothetical protein
MTTTPTSADGHVVQVLTDWAIQYANDANDFKADLLAPNIGHKHRAVRIHKYDKAPWFTDEMEVRAEGADVPMSKYTLSNSLFEVPVWSLGKPIDDQQRDNEDDILDADEDATQFLMGKERIRREARFSEKCLTTGVWGTDVTGNTSASVYGSNTVAQWDDGDSHPLLDIAEYRSRVKLATGLWPNVLAIGSQVWDKLKYHDDILEAMRGGSTSQNPSKATLQAVASLMELEEIVVMDAVKNTADLPQAMTGAFIAGKHGLLMHRNMNAGRKGATAVKTLTWQRPGCDARGFRILKSKKNIHVDIVEVEANYEIIIPCNDLGVFFNGLVG